MRWPWVTNRYPPEELDADSDNGTMPENVEALADAVIGRKIVLATRDADTHKTIIELDNGKRVVLRDTSDCCAYTELEDFLLNPDAVRHMILGVGTTEGYSRWHIFADFGDVMELKVGWSAGNPFYYGYGFDIEVVEPPS